jgi:DNA-binding NarL/FixJ family response regulator
MRSGLQRTRIALIGLPQMLRDTVSEIVSAEPDLTVVAELDDLASAGATIGAQAVGVLITAVGDCHPIDFRTLLTEHPRLRVLCLSADGREGSLFELRPHEQTLGEISPEVLIAAIRGFD